MLILIGAACLAWILLFSAVFVNLSGFPGSKGWLIAAGLTFAAAAWALVAVRELRNAVELPDPFGGGDLPDRERFHPESAEISPVFPADRIPGGRWIPVEEAVRRRPRKARSSRIEIASPENFHPDV